MAEEVNTNQQGAGEGQQNTDPNAGNAGQQQQGAAGQGQGSEETKSYTQAQINSMMANEKRTARQAILKELGYEYKDDKGFKDLIKGIKESLDAGKTQAQKDSEAKTAAERERDEANSKASFLELKIAALSAEADPKYLEDLITLAKPKLVEGVTVESVFESLKKQYPVFFKGADNTGSSGTGSPNNPPRKGTSNVGEYGQRLAKGTAKGAVKSSYFKK